jgi:hypothetical protein
MSRDPDSTYITVGGVRIGRLQRTDHAWQLSSVPPTIFQSVSFAANDKDEAVEHAKDWIAGHNKDTFG